MPIQLVTEDPAAIPAQTELSAGHERDDFQREVDSHVGALKIATAKAGWPQPEPTKHFRRYVVAPEDKAALKGVIRRACTLHKVEAVFYKDVKTAAGHVAVKFHVARKLDKNGKPVADSTLDRNGTPVAP